MILVMFETWWDKHLWTQRLRCRLWKSLLQCWRCREPAPTIGDIELVVLKHFDTHSDIRNFDIALKILTHIFSCHDFDVVMDISFNFLLVTIFSHFWWRNVYFNPVWHLHRGRFEAQVLTGSKRLSHLVCVLGVMKGFGTDSRADIKRERSQSWGREAGWKVRVTS